MSVSLHFASVWEPIGYGIGATLTLAWTLYIDRGFPWWHPVAWFWMFFWPMWLVMRVGLLLIERSERHARERLYREYPWLRDLDSHA